ncbi:MAG: dTMP kinase [Chloroflexi bacterium]|nr:dTMP kinase [Chloroflexota bacterium]
MSSPNHRPGSPGQHVTGDALMLPGTPDTVVKKDMRLKKGLFITFEGGEGVGKTTQVTRLVERIATTGLSVKNAREPGATPLGEEIRAWVKGEAGTTPVAELLLFAAARAQLVSDFLKPNLSRGGIVVLDRYVDSTVAYQGYGRGLDIGQIDEVNRVATGGLMPDLTILLDAEPSTGLGRVDAAPTLFDGAGGGSPGKRLDPENERRFEREPITFHEKVRNGFRELAKEGGRWCVIRADQPAHRVADAIWKRVRPLLIERGVDEELLWRKQAKQV